MTAACVDDEEEDGEDAEGHDSAEDDDATGMRAVVALGFTIEGAVGRNDEGVCGTHDCEMVV